MTNLDKLRRIIDGIPDIPQCHLTEDTEFRIDLGLDSVDLAEIMVAMERVFEIQIHEDEFEELLTIEELLAFIDQKQCLTTQKSLSETMTILQQTPGNN